MDLSREAKPALHQLRVAAMRLIAIAIGTAIVIIENRSHQNDQLIKRLLRNKLTNQMEDRLQQLRSFLK